jgi:hypothetical protein
MALHKREAKARKLAPMSSEKRAGASARLSTGRVSRSMVAESGIGRYGRSLVANGTQRMTKNDEARRKSPATG